MSHGLQILDISSVTVKCLMTMGQYLQSLKGGENINAKLAALILKH